MNSQQQAKSAFEWKKLFEYRSPCCKHEGSCFWNFLTSIKRSFFVGYTIRFSFNTLFTLLRLKKSLQNPSQMFYKLFLCDGDFRMPAFITIMNSVMRLSQCLLRYARGKDDGFTSFCSGFIGAFLGMMFENKENWYNWRMFLGGRAIHMVYNSLVNRGYIKENSMNYAYAFAFCSALIAKGYFHEPKIINPELFKLYKGFSHLSEGENIWHYCQSLCDERKLMAQLNRPFDGMSMSDEI